MKSQQSQVDQQTGTQLYALIYNTFNHNQVQKPQVQVQNDDD
jgi:citrate lyase gamma subunit